MSSLASSRDTDAGVFFSPQAGLYHQFCTFKLCDAQEGGVRDLS